MVSWSRLASRDAKPQTDPLSEQRVSRQRALPTLESDASAELLHNLSRVRCEGNSAA